MLHGDIGIYLPTFIVVQTMTIYSYGIFFADSWKSLTFLLSLLLSAEYACVRSELSLVCQ